MTGAPGCTRSLQHPGSDPDSNPPYFVEFSRDHSARSLEPFERDSNPPDVCSSKRCDSAAATCSPGLNPGGYVIECDGID